jgi:hypothetical protein
VPLAGRSPALYQELSEKLVLFPGLNLSNCFFGDKEAILTFIKLLAKCSKLKSLVLEKAVIASSMLSVLFQGLPTVIRDLSLAGKVMQLLLLKV